MQFEKFTPETVSEILLFLADHEKFDSVKGLKNITKSDISALFKELASNINDSAAKYAVAHKNTLKKKDFPETVHRVISKLTPQEETMLLKSFRIS